VQVCLDTDPNIPDELKDMMKAVTEQPKAATSEDRLNGFNKVMYHARAWKGNSQVRLGDDINDPFEITQLLLEYVTHPDFAVRVLLEQRGASQASPVDQNPGSPV
jgi:hypothetical protein